MKMLNFLLTILLLIFGLCFTNAFGKENTQLGLPAGVKARIGKGSVKEIKYFPDGSKLAVASTIGIWVYDVHTGEPIDLLTGHTGPVNSIVFSPDGNTFASASDDNTARLWDAHTRQHKASFVGHGDDVNSVAFSPDGKTLASGSDDDSVCLWNLQTGEQISRFEAHARNVSTVTFSPDGSFLASIAESREDTICLWNPHTGKLMNTIDRDSMVKSIFFSVVGNILASSSRQRTINLSDVNTDTRLVTCETEEWMHRVGGVEISPDGRTLAGVYGSRWAGGVYGVGICFWDVTSGKLIKSIEQKDAISSVAFSPDGSFIAGITDNGKIQFWNVAARKLQKTIYKLWGSYVINGMFPR